MRENKLRTIWKAGGSVVNGWLAVPNSFSAEVMANQGWDSVTADMQHGIVDYQAMVTMLQAISTTNTVPITITAALLIMSALLFLSEPDGRAAAIASLPPSTGEFFHHDARRAPTSKCGVNASGSPRTASAREPYDSRTDSNDCVSDCERDAGVCPELRQS